MGQKLIQQCLLMKLNLLLSQYIAAGAAYTGGPQYWVPSISINNSNFGATSYIFLKKEVNS